MAYDRYDMRGGPRDERSRWSGDRDRFGQRGREDERGFFERAGDEISSWFGDDEAERRRDRDRRMDEQGYGDGRYGRDRDRGDTWRDRTRSSAEYRGDRDRERESGFFSGRGYRATGGESGQHWSSWGGARDDPSYRPMNGDYSRSEGFFAARGIRDEGDTPRSPSMDPHYHSWRKRQMDELDRDYDDYRRENQARFEEDFGQWRSRRKQKRALLGQVREHMEVIGNDDEHVGTVDRAVSDRIILTKSDPEGGGAHHSLSCSDIEGLDGDRVVLECSAEEARQRWRDETRNRALFERDDQGEMGPRMLDRSFEGTYR